MIGLTCKEPFLRSGIPYRSLITPWPHKHRIGGFDQFIATVDADLHFFLIGFKRGIVDFYKERAFGQFLCGYLEIAVAHQLYFSIVRNELKMHVGDVPRGLVDQFIRVDTVSYTHLRAHETDSYLVCRLL